LTDKLPKGFSNLAPYLDWARSTELSRNEKRWSATLEESQAFYDTMLAHAPAALDYLNQFTLDHISRPENDADRRLLDLCLSLAEVSATVEMYENPQPKYVFPIQRFVPTHDAWPLARKGDRT